MPGRMKFNETFYLKRIWDCELAFGLARFGSLTFLNIWIKPKNNR